MPQGVVINLWLSVTLRVVPRSKDKATNLERIFMPMHEQLAAGLPSPDI